MTLEHQHLLMWLHEAKEDADHHGTKSNTTLTSIFFNGPYLKWCQWTQ